MKLTKKLEIEVLNAYHIYWDSYLSGDIKTFASLLDDNCHIIGSTAHDTFNNKKDAVAFYKATAKEVAGVGEYRNRNITVLPEGNNVMVQEICDYYFLNKKEWHFYGVARLSTLFSKRSGKWKIIHQHGSLPDSRAGQGQQLGTEKITKENLRLKEAIKRNTVELQNKNRELEIETALEKVRAVAMSMHHPDDMLGVCKVLYHELLSLGFNELRNTLIQSFVDERNYFIDYDYSDATGGHISKIPYSGHPAIEKFIKNIRKSADAFNYIKVDGKQLKDWIAFRKANKEANDPRLNKIKALHYYNYSVGPAGIGISTYSPIPKEKQELLQRFRNVFQLAYQRYADITLAEAQAREAQVEASLERVRAMAMAMHHQEDLVKICETCYKEFNALGFDGLRNAMINIYNDEQKTFVNYDYSDVLGKSINHLTYSIHPEIEKQIKQVRKSNDAFSETVFKGKGLESMKKFRKKIGEKDDPRIKNCKALYYYFYSIGSGAIGISTFNPVTKEKLELLKRFRNVFTLSYQRYTDIALAEAQAREAEIELALERVRARTMAMQKSEDLAETSFVLFEQFKKLGETSDQISIGIFNEAGNFMDLYSTVNGLQWKEAAKVDLDEPVVLKKLYAAWKQQKKSLVIDLTGNELRKYNAYRKKFSGRDYNEKRWVIHAAFFSKGVLTFSITEPHDTIQLLERFAAVFDGTYTRFLDLQKAEGQAREAQIEASLERVRSRSLAMHNTSELQDVINTVHNELLHLNIAIDGGSFIAINSDIETTLRCWGAGGTADTTEEVHLPLYKKPFCTNLINSIKKGPGFFTEAFTQKEKKDFFTFLFKHEPWSKLKAKEKKEILSSLGGYTRSCCVSKHTSIFIINHHGEIFSVADNDILKRFGKVFEQAYTRFLDLQKAEAQAREAEIELALERVRARTMAMQSSNELAETATLLFQQINELGIETWTSGFNIWEKNDRSFMGYNPTPDGGITPPYQIPATEDSFFKKIHKAKKSGEEFLVFESSGKTLATTYRYMKTLPVVEDVLKGIEKAGHKLPASQINHCCFFTHGFLLFITLEPLPDAHDIFKRFGKVFDQTYTRFLDLQKAEAQARESQIELGLERVRARAMAMQHSDELSQLVDTVFKELASLDFALNWCIINIIDEPSLTNMVWAANPDTNKPPESYLMKFEDYPFHHSMMKGYQERKAKHVYVLEGKEKKEYDEYLFNKTEWRRVPKKAQAASKAMKRYVASFTFSNFGGLQTVGEEPLSEENLDILSRFGKVFDLTYTRFNDLQKAEAQSREAQIELGLERVRARAMAMQNSDELRELIGTVFTELTKLDLALTRCIIWVFEKSTNAASWWMANSEEPSNPMNFYLKYHEHPAYLTFVNAWKNQNTKFVYDLKDRDKIAWDNILFNETELQHLPAAVKNGMKAPARVLLSASFNNFGGINTASLDPLSEEHFDILLRFAKVFDLTYTRFNDLKQAEAQAREARIETALEKVRSRSMGMQKSEELKEVIKIVYQQLNHLKIKLDHAGFVVDYTAKGDWHFWIADEQDIPSKISHPYFESVWANQFNEAKEKGSDFFATHLNFEEKNKFYTELLSYVPGLPQASKDFYLSCPGLAASTVLFDNVSLYIENFSGTPYTDEENKILMRFGKVFQQTYTRFLDLQKAEAQAREAKIETALEKVRSRTMAMQKSTELGETATLLFEQMNALVPDLWSCGFVLCDKNKSVDEWWLSGGNGYMPDLILPNTGDLTHSNIYKAWLQGSSYHEEVVEGEELQQHYEWLMTIPVAKAAFDAQAAAGIQRPVWQQLSCAYFTQGYLVVITEVPCHEIDLFKRFAKVFDQTYTRFLDLQKAEAQARESQIQLALERARTQSMIMQHSNELDDTLRVFHEQVLLLGIKSAFSFLWLPDEEKSNHIFWAVWGEEKDDTSYFKSKAITYPLDRNEPATKQCLIDWKSDEPVHSYTVTPAEVNNYFAAWVELLDGVEKLKPEYFPYGLHYVEAFMKYGCFGVMVETTLTNDEKNILGRFAVEFERTYTRFLDLQKAETQAREAQIEASLERVRSRTMGMQKSDELAETVSVLFKQLLDLGVQSTQLRTCGIVTFKENKPEGEIWITDINGDIIADPFVAPFDEAPAYKSVYAAWKNDEKFLVLHLRDEAFLEHLAYVKKYSNVPNINMEEIQKNYDQIFFHVMFFSKGYLFVISYEPLPEHHDIFKRFGALFQQTYTRFLDFKQAEAQAREAKIEMALEKIRSRTMAMQHSDELPEAANLLFLEVQALGIPAWSAGYNILSEDKKSSSCIMSSEGTLQLPFELPLTGESSFLEWYDFLQSGEQFFVQELGGKELQEHYGYMKSLPELKIIFQHIQDSGLSLPTYQINHLVKYTHGFLLFITYEEAPYAHDIFKRFTKVFEQTYTRFLDLQKAEAQARESQIETGLERVRSRTLAMQKSDELAETAVVLFQQLILLGIAPNRLYITIINEAADEADFWITDEDGSKITTAYTASLNANSTFAKMYEGWKQHQKKLVIDMQGEELQQYFQYLQSINVPFKGGLEQKRRVQHLAYFSRGFIGMASPDEQPAETLQVLERFAAVFNLTFTRFNDLKIAEAHAVQAEQDLIAIKDAKQKAEEALSELQSTQKQLIQSEKMASLGELTAGIAHEIQNPLNFVNNFSEVSKELLDEMKTELDSGNIEDAKEIMADVIQNLEKINHHGKRADGIVKGMLQHSRSSNGAKELTDINALCDEYLRLSYHGLRAKDKSFNATMKTDFDSSIGNVNIIPQDIGRVVLNLLTNAFYVVDEKKKSEVDGYEPTVSISTKKINDKVEIKVTDNGKGMPETVKEKIFQPFFTTKPTGQGTGLGLSLSYDIITKGHGGELKVETKEGEGSSFIITIPIV